MSFSNNPRATRVPGEAMVPPVKTDLPVLLDLLDFPDPPVPPEIRESLDLLELLDPLVPAEPLYVLTV